MRADSGDLTNTPEYGIFPILIGPAPPRTLKPYAHEHAIWSRDQVPHRRKATRTSGKPSPDVRGACLGGASKP